MLIGVSSKSREYKVQDRRNRAREYEESEYILYKVSNKERGQYKSICKMKLKDQVIYWQLEIDCKGRKKASQKEARNKRKKGIGYKIQSTKQGNGSLDNLEYSLGK